MTDTSFTSEYNSVAAPYTKSQSSSAIDDGWTIRDGDGAIIAHVDTETMADALMGCLLQSPYMGIPANWPSYPSDVPINE